MKNSYRQNGGMGKWVESENCVNDLLSAKKLLLIYKDNIFLCARGTNP